MSVESSFFKGNFAYLYIIVVMCIFIYYPFIMIYVYQAAGWPSIALFSKYLDEHRCFGSGFVSLFDVVLIVFKCSAVLIVFKCSAV